MPGHHVILALESRAVLASDAAAYRRAAVAALAAARPFRLLALRVSDTHAHSVFAGSREEAVEGGRRMALTLRWALDLEAPWRPASVVEVRDQRHLDNAFAYVLRQDAHHGFANDPHHDGSNAPDLLGWRVSGAWTRAHVLAALPRRTREDIAELLGLSIGTAQGDLDLLAEAAAAAVGAESLRGRSAEVVLGRRAAVHAVDAGTKALADALAVPQRTIQRLRAEKPDAEVVTAVRGQLAFREAVRQRQADPWKPAEHAGMDGWEYGSR